MKEREPTTAEFNAALRRLWKLKRELHQVQAIGTIHRLQYFATFALSKAKDAAQRRAALRSAIELSTHEPSRRALIAQWNERNAEVKAALDMRSAATRQLANFNPHKGA